MHGDGLGMSVGVADEELYYSPTTGPAAGPGASGSPASGGTGTLQKLHPGGTAWAGPHREVQRTLWAVPAPGPGPEPGAAARADSGPTGIQRTFGPLHV